MPPKFEMMSFLNKLYGEIEITELPEGNYQYAYTFDYAEYQRTLEITYFPETSKITLTLRFLDDYKEMVTFDDDIAYKIMMYLEVFYPIPHVEVSQGKLTLSDTYTFTPTSFDINDFSEAINTLEQMAREVSDMVSRNDFYDDHYQDALYRGTIHKEMLKDDFLFWLLNKIKTYRAVSLKQS